MSQPTMLEMLKAGVHFGHKNSKWHPNMEPFIFTTKKNVHIINLEETEKRLEQACKVVKDLASQGKTILFVGTKRQAAPIVEKYAILAGMPYVTNRWLGGTLTNFSHVSHGPRKLTKLKREKETGELEKYTKKEQLEFSREIEKLEELVGGIEEMNKLPDAVFIVDMVKEQTALAEAKQLGIPVIAMCDTNANPRDIAYPIPANDDAIKAIELVVKAVADSAGAGKEAAPTAEAAEKTEAKKETPAKAAA